MTRSRARLVLAGAFVLTALAGGCGRGEDPTASSAAGKQVREDARRSAQSAGSQASTAAINLAGARLTATDGPGTLEQVTGAYRTHLSYRANLHAEVTLNFGPMRQIAQDTLVVYSQAPSRALLHIRDPLGGTNDYYADGRSLVHYRGVTNVYQRRPCPAGLPEITAEIDKDAPLLLNPLSFVTANTRPMGVETVKLEKDDSIGNRPMAVVSGQLTAPFVSRISGPLLGFTAPARERTYKLWIDRATSVVRKSEIHLSWVAHGHNLPNTPLPTNPTVDIVERTDDALFDVQVKSDEFRFSPPANAKEVFQAFP